MPDSTTILHGIVILNGLAVIAAFLWAWRRGHLKDLNGVTSVVFPDDDEKEARGDERD